MGTSVFFPGCLASFLVDVFCFGLLELVVYPERDIVSSIADTSPWRRSRVCSTVWRPCMLRFGPPCSTRAFSAAKKASPQDLFRFSQGFSFCGFTCSWFPFLFWPLFPPSAESVYFFLGKPTTDGSPVRILATRFFFPLSLPCHHLWYFAFRFKTQGGMCLVFRICFLKLIC